LGIFLDPLTDHIIDYGSYIDHFAPSVNSLGSLMSHNGKSGALMDQIKGLVFQLPSLEGGAADTNAAIEF
jgi:hypothetical protein